MIGYRADDFRQTNHVKYSDRIQVHVKYLANVRADQEDWIGIDALIVVPFPGFDTIRHVPFQISTRSFMLCRPYPLICLEV